MTLSKPRRLYLIPVLSKALDIFELLESEHAPMTLERIHRQSKISKTTVYRVLKTYVHRGYLTQSPDGLYRQVLRPKKVCFGFTGHGLRSEFAMEVMEGLTLAAVSAGVDFNRFWTTTARLPVPFGMHKSSLRTMLMSLFNSK